jgi:altronate hydrolase
MIDVSAKRVIGPVIRMHPGDNVVVARTDLLEGTQFSSDGIVARQNVPAGYKIAAVDMQKGAPITKYNVTVGFAEKDLPAGTLLHNHNTEFRDFDRDYAHASDYRPIAMVPERERATFEGIVRDDGRVATRNYIGIVSTVDAWQIGIVG